MVCNGAQYHGDLTKAVTHLIAAGPRGKKFEYAGQWGIKIVTVEWLRDSLERGMVLDESLYHPLLPEEERGKGAVTRHKPTAESLGKRARAQEQTVDPAEVGRRKLRRTASSRLGSQSDNLWADIGSGQDGQSDRRRSLQRQDRFWDVKSKETSMVGRNALPTPQSDDVMRPISRERQMVAGAEDKNRPGVATESHIFQNEVLYVYGFGDQKTEILVDFITSNGARAPSEGEVKARKDCDTDLSSLSITVIVPHNADLDTVQKTRDLPFLFPEDWIATEFWVEKCLHRKALISKETPLCRPFYNGPIPGKSAHSKILRPLLTIDSTGFDKLTICPTSFTGIDLLHFSKTVKLLGAKYDESLRPETSVLVCSDGVLTPNPEKVRYALKTGVPLVKAAWMWKCVEEGVIKEFEDFAFGKKRDGENSRGGTNNRHNVLEPERPTDRLTGNGDTASYKTRERATKRSPSPKRHTKHAITSEMTTEKLPNQSAPDPHEPSHAPDEPTEFADTAKTKDATSTSSKPLQDLRSTINTPLKKQHQALPQPSPPKNTKIEIALTSNANTVTANGSARSLLSSAISHLRSVTSHARPPTNPARSESPATGNPQPDGVSPKSAEAGDADPRDAARHRRHRPLGRAPSNPSSLTRSHFSAEASPPAADGDDGTAGEVRDPAASFKPSQALVYESEETVREREEARRRMGIGCGVDGGGYERVERVGVVKDGNGRGRDEEGEGRRTRRKK